MIADSAEALGVRWGTVSGDASQWATFDAVDDVNIADFDILGVDRLQFIIANASGAPRRS